MTTNRRKPFEFKEVAPVQRSLSSYFIYACYTAVAALMISTFVQNFLISESLGHLSLREIDDLAFQQVIRQVHLAIYTGAYTDIWQINDYGYGWIYWIFISIVTFPFYLISRFNEIDWPLIVVPRQISLIFTILSLLVMGKLLRKSGVSPSGVASAILIFCLYPTMGYFSMRFGTVSAVAFFALLSFYFAWTDKPSTFRGRSWAMLSLAIAGAIKLNGLLIAPLVCCLVVLHISDRSIGGILKAMAIPAALFMAALVTFTNPALLYAFIEPNIFYSYKDTMIYFLDSIKKLNDNISPMQRAYIGTLGNIAYATEIALLFMGILLGAIRFSQRRADYFLVFASIFAISIYLTIAVTSPVGIGLYVTVILFLFVLGVAGWENTRIGGSVIAIIIALSIANTAIRFVTLFKIDIAQRVTGYSYPVNLLGHFTYFVKKQDSVNIIEDSRVIEACIPDLSERIWTGHIFSDYTVTLLANGLTNPDACFSIAWGNLSAERRYCDKRIDYLVLNKHAPGAQSEKEFERYLADKGPDAIPALLEDRQSRLELHNTGRFGDQQFSLKCETQRIQIFTSQQ